MVLSVTTKLYYDGAENATWETDVVDVVVEQNQGEAGFCEVHLTNEGNKYSVGGANAISTDLKRLQVYVQMGAVRGWNRNGWWFSGFIYDVDTSKEGIAIVRAGDAAWFLSRKKLYCWQTQHEGVSIYQVMIMAKGSMTYRTIYPTNFPYVGFAGSRRPLIVSANVAPVNSPMMRVEFAETTSLLEACEQLRQYVDATLAMHVDPVTWEVVGFLWPKDYYSAVVQASPSAAWALYSATEKLVFRLSTGVPSATYETIVHNSLARTRGNFADRVVVVGSLDARGTAGATSEESKLEHVLSDTTLRDHGDCKRKAAMLLEEMNAERYEGSIEVALYAYQYEWAYWLGYIFRITDAQLSDVDLYLHLIGVKHELRRGVTTLYFGEEFRDMVHHLRRQKVNLENQQYEKPLNDLFECEVQTQETFTETEQGFYAILGDDVVVAANPGAPAGRLRVEWQAGDTRPSTDLTGATFDSYVVVYDTVSKLPKSWGGEGVTYQYAGDWDKADDANLANIATTSTVLTGLAAATTYYVRVFLRTTKGKWVPWSMEASANSS